MKEQELAELILTLYHHASTENGSKVIEKGFSVDLKKEGNIYLLYTIYEEGYLTVDSTAESKPIDQPGIESYFVKNPNYFRYLKINNTLSAHKFVRVKSKMMFGKFIVYWELDTSKWYHKIKSFFKFMLNALIDPLNSYNH